MEIRSRKSCQKQSPVDSPGQKSPGNTCANLYYSREQNRTIAGQMDSLEMVSRWSASIKIGKKIY